MSLIISLATKSGKTALNKILYFNEMLTTWRKTNFCIIDSRKGHIVSTKLIRRLPSKNDFYSNIGSLEKKKKIANVPESKSFSCCSFSFWVLNRASVDRCVSRNAFRWLLSVRYLVYIPAKLTAAYNRLIAVNWRATQSAF